LIGEPLRNLEEKTFLLLTFIVTLAFAWVLWPFYGAILWGAVVAILFAPVNRRLLVAMPHKPNSAALATIAIILLIVILPLVIVAIALIQEAAALFAQIQSGEINFTVYFQQVSDALPVWAKSFAFDPFSCLQDGLAASEVDVGRCEIAEALVVAPVIVMIDEGVDLRFESTRQEVVFEQDAVLQRLVPSLDLALGLGMVRGEPRVCSIPCRRANRPVRRRRNMDHCLTRAVDVASPWRCRSPMPAGPSSSVSVTSRPSSWCIASRR
jgi:hypothetical protein